ncbi:sigma-70 family RNA polymerase sigma factor [Pseudoflavitalea sp. X16]|uniref:RNA polymerase sigma factor n=1 Tax=Paraflavitalea devenefica TaxID=2716334 RepID=UPI00141EAE38|nr:sigma-70 family RNA polymerase sigma factor [Paraflavitalea devenefica]NII29072.1 sigma-70 family RNA polymerase sigma factor [Paraflavitalea devenefica]
MDSLIEQIAEGDEQAFARFYRFYYPQLLPFLQRHVAEKAEADEILQQVFLRVWLNRDMLPEIRHMKAWLSKITAREYLRVLHNKLTRRERFPLEMIDDQTEVASTPSSQPLSLKELNKTIQQGVERLSPQRREVFTLSRSHSLTIQEIADRLQLSPQTVKNTLTAALREVRSFLQEQGYTFTFGVLLSLCYFIFKKI